MVIFWWVLFLWKLSLGICHLEIHNRHLVPGMKSDSKKDTNFATLHYGEVDFQAILIFLRKHSIVCRRRIPRNLKNIYQTFHSIRKKNTKIFWFCNHFIVCERKLWITVINWSNTNYVNIFKGFGWLFIVYEFNVFSVVYQLYYGGPTYNNSAADDFQNIPENIWELPFCKSTLID